MRSSRRLVETIGLLSQSVDDKATAIKRLLRMIFGAKTETMEKIFKNRSKLDGCARKRNLNRSSNRVTAKTARTIIKRPSGSRCPIQDLKAGDPCPECPKGKVYPIKKAGIVVRFVGMAPLAAKIYELEKLRCNLCGEVFTADAPGQCRFRQV